MTLVQRTCIACGEDERDPQGRRVLLRLPDAGRPGECYRCGGHMLAITEFEDRVVIVEPVDWRAPEGWRADEKPRRGRPPRWLILQRAAQRLAQEASA